MTLLRASIRHEWRTQLRSTRYRLLVALYLVASCLPMVYQLLMIDRSNMMIGAVSYLQPTFELQPFLVAMFSALLSLDGIEREKSEGSWSIISSTGTSNASYLLARWGGLLSTQLPWTLLPPIAAATLPLMLGLPVADSLHYWAPWFAWVLPSALAASGGALAIGTLMGGWIGSLIFYFGLTLVAAPLWQRVLAFFHTTWERSSWPDSTLLSIWVNLILGANAPEGQRFGYAQIPFSEAPLNLHRLVHEQLADNLFVLTLGVSLLGVAALFLGRTAPDVRPWRIPAEHPLRTYLKWVSNLRMRYWPDPKPLAVDLAVLASALLLLITAGTYRTQRSQYFERLAAERYAAEADQEALVNDRTLVPVRYALRGELLTDGELKGEVEIELHNQGSAPVSAVMFQLNAGIDAAPLDESISVTRTWDRLRLDLPSVLQPGETRTLHLRTTGHAESVIFRLRGYGNMPFHVRYQNFLNARQPQDLSELALSQKYRYAGHRFVRLTGMALLPLPRYTTWKRTPPPSSPGETGDQVPDEEIFPLARFDLDLGTPEGWLITSSCGDLIAPESMAQARLESSCKLPVDRMAILGGKLVLAPIQPETAQTDAAQADAAQTDAAQTARLAILPQHRQQAALHRPALEEALTKLEQAWPGVTNAQGLVFLESPMSASGFSAGWRSYEEFQSIPTFDKVVLLYESDLILTEPIPTTVLVSRIARAQIRQARTLRSDHEILMIALLDYLVRQRLGELEAPTAVVAPAAWLKKGYRSSVVEAPSSWSPAIRSRLPALLHYLQYLVGTPTVYEAVDRFLARPSDQAGHLDEWMALLEEGSEVDLSAFREHLLYGTALPEPVLDGVRFQRRGDRWHATGRVHNEADGTVTCPLVLYTDLTPVDTVVQVTGEGSTSFELTTRHQPQALALDPNGRCFRLARERQTRVEFRP